MGACRPSDPRRNEDLEGEKNPANMPTPVLPSTWSPTQRGAFSPSSPAQHTSCRAGAAAPAEGRNQASGSLRHLLDLWSWKDQKRPLHPCYGCLDGHQSEGTSETLYLPNSAQTTPLWGASLISSLLWQRGSLSSSPPLCLVGISVLRFPHPAMITSFPFCLSH